MPSRAVHAAAGSHTATRNALMPLSEPGSLGELVQLMGLSGDRPRGADIPVTLWRVRQGATLIHEGSRGEALFVVRCGSLKAYKTLEDGYEQLLSFAQAGEIVGFEALHSGVQPASVAALEGTSVYALPVQELQALQQACPALGLALHHALSRQLVRAAETAHIMAAVASEVRLARFLLWWSARMAEAGQSPHRLRLRMCRRDIASLLGVAHETVSRSFTTLAETGCLKVDNRDVRILDAAALRERARSTRGPSGDDRPGADSTRRAAAPAQRVPPEQRPALWHSSLLQPEPAGARSAL
jgi:CRP/FNR family transcriptional regulator, anaerobic regulatory protein